LPREPDRSELVGATRRCAPYSFNLGCGSFSFALQSDPTVALDPQDAYIKHLQELRRINEGDDTADGPGYALYLLRIPVSVRPGQKTQKGYGAEVSVNIRIPQTNALLKENIVAFEANRLQRR